MQQSLKSQQSQAYKYANAHLLELGEGLNVDPDVLISNGNGIFCAGAQGFGKSIIMKRILEEIACKTSVPIVSFDKEDDLKAMVDYFPRGILASYRNCPTAKDIYGDGLQVVYDLSTWPDMNAAGYFISRLVNTLMDESDSVPFNLRVPCIVALDEASYWLPQNRKVSRLKEDTLDDLHNAFESLASRGRKRGLVPALFTQRFSHIAKEVLSPGTYILLAQNLHTERKRYLDYILPVGEFKYYTERQTMQRIGDLKPGEAIVKLADGQQAVAQFYECRSPHVARTPRAQAAINRYANMPFTPNKNYGGYVKDEEASITGNLDEETSIVEPVVPIDSKYAHVVVDMSLSKSARVRSVLAQDNTLRNVDVVRIAGVDATLVSHIRKHAPVLSQPEEAKEAKPTRVKRVYNKRKKEPTLKDQIFAALDANMDLSPMELASKFGCELQEAKDICMDYFMPRPISNKEVRTPRKQSK